MGGTLMPLGVGRLTVSSPSSFCKFSELQTLQAIFASESLPAAPPLCWEQQRDFSTLATFGYPSAPQGRLDPANKGRLKSSQRKPLGARPKKSILKRSGVPVPK